MDNKDIDILLEDELAFKLKIWLDLYEDIINDDNKETLKKAYYYFSGETYEKGFKDGRA
jgi:hypothetical protein